ncbi:Protein cueball [Sergentomyia squamirostris]
MKFFTVNVWISLVGFFLNVHVISSSADVSNWEFAVTTGDHMMFYDSNWTKLRTHPHHFTDPSAIIYDETENNIFFVGQTHDNEGSIYLLRLNEGDVPKMLLQVENDHINGLAYDPLERNLYWIDSGKKQIAYATLDDSDTLKNHSVFMEFSTGLPQGITIDICRRIIYWTNHTNYNGTIERASLVERERKVLVTSIHKPMGIAVDHFTDQIFWLNNEDGIYFAVETAFLTGTKRRKVYEGRTNDPINLVVDRNNVYWTDSYQQSVWKISKNASLRDDAEKVHSVFDSIPHGIILRTHFFEDHVKHPQCEDVIEKLRHRRSVLAQNRSKMAGNSTVDCTSSPQRNLNEFLCLHKGAYDEKTKGCLCPNGFTGDHCETSICHNFCVWGKCSVNENGDAQCDCDPGFRGKRCEESLCTGYCYNSAGCTISRGQPICTCPSNYGGLHCEILLVTDGICKVFCELGYNASDLGWNLPIVCGECQPNTTIIHASKSVEPSETGHEKKIKVTWFILVSAILSALLLVNIICFLMWRFHKPIRPIIKKTYRVQKNLTPLTSRPDGYAEQQCEITIENCCNMNICDTPCFDPKNLHEQMQKESRKEDKKKLLNHLVDANGDLF